MPAPADKPVAFLRGWLPKHAHVMGPIPPPRTVREELLDRWTAHTAHCRHCQAALKALPTWRRRTIAALAVAALGGPRLAWARRALGALCVCLLGLYSVIEREMTFSDYKHWRS